MDKATRVSKTFNFFWAASLLLLLMWIQVAKASAPASDSENLASNYTDPTTADAAIHYSDQDILEVLSKDDPNGLLFIRHDDNADISAANLALTN